MVAGKTHSPLSATFHQGCSQIIGFKRVVSAGTVGYPRILSIGIPPESDPTTAVVNIYLQSSSNTDQSTYRVYWYNPVANKSIEQLHSILPFE